MKTVSNAEQRVSENVLEYLALDCPIIGPTHDSTD